MNPYNLVYMYTILFLTTAWADETTTQSTLLTTESPFAQCTFTQNIDGVLTCYKLMNQNANHSSAQKLCNGLHRRGQLAAVTSPELYQLVLDQIKKQSLSFVWLGLKEFHFPWKWLDGSGTVQLQGCFKDNPSDPDLEIRAILKNNSYSECIQHCKTKGKAYAGVQNKDVCWCGNSFGRYQQDSECNMRCPGNSEEVCGGSSSSVILAVNGTHSNWHPGQPNNHTGAQSCGCQDGRNYDFEWNDETCVLNNYAMCQLEYSEAECNNRSATWIGNTCYIMSTEILTFYQSRDWCRSQQGELATYTNATQEAEVRKFLNATYNKQTIWVALSRSLWKWDTGEEMMFSSWASGEPNAGTSQPCVKMDDAGLWRTSFCGGLASIICQIDNETETTVASPVTTAQTTTVQFTSTRAPLDEGTVIAMIAGAGGIAFILIILGIKFCCCTKNGQKDGNFVGIEEELIQSPNPNNYFFGVENPAVAREEEAIGNGVIIEAKPTDEKPKVNGNNNMNNSLIDNMNDTASYVYGSDGTMIKNASEISVTADVHSENTDENYFTLSTENGSSHSEGSADAIDMQELTNDVAYESLQRPGIGQPNDASNSDQGYDSLTKSDPAYANNSQSINSYENHNPSDKLPLIDESHSSIEYTPSVDDQVVDDSTLGRERQRQLSKSTEELMDTIPRHRDVSYHDIADSMQALNDLEKHLNSAI